jgi:hypothetical protein
VGNGGVAVLVCFVRDVSGEPLEPLLAVLAAQLGTPKGRCDEHSGKFPSIIKPRFNRPVGERNHF